VWQRKTQAPITVGTTVIVFQEVSSNLAQYALLAVANVFTQPQTVPNASQPQHAVPLAQVTNGSLPLETESTAVNDNSARHQPVGFWGMFKHLSQAALPLWRPLQDSRSALGIQGILNPHLGWAV
jgi:hypothetical protein